MKITLLSIILFSSLAVISQDLVVTLRNDSVNCKINKITKNQIWYYTKAEQFVRPLREIKSYIKGYYNDNKKKPTKKEQSKPVKEATNQGSIKDTPNTTKKSNATHLYFSLYGGYSRLTGKTFDDVNPSLIDYIDELKSGYHIGGDLYYYTKTGWGFGIFYNRFYTSNSLNNVLFTDSATGMSKTGPLESNITHSFLGVSFAKRFKINHAIYLEVYADIGYLGYKDKAVFINPVTISAWTISESIGGILDYKISKNSYLILKASFNVGITNNFTATYENGETIDYTLEDNKYENLSKINLSAGIRFSF